MSYQTFYKVACPKGSVILDFENRTAACFSSYNYSNEIEFGAHEVHLFILKEYQRGVSAAQLFNKAQVFEHVRKLNEAGFPNTITEEGKRYIVTLREKDYISKTHIRVAIDFVRILWENDINKTLEQFYRIPVEIRDKYDYLLMLQLMQASLRANHKIKSGHTLPSGSYLNGKKSLLEAKEVLTGLQTIPKLNGSTDLWSKISQKNGKASCLTLEENKALASFDLRTEKGILSALNLLK